MSDLILGCTAVVVKSLCLENIGKIVVLGKYIHSHYDETGFLWGPVWEVSQLMVCTDNIDRCICSAINLQRIDDHKEKEYTKQIQKLTV